MNEIFNLPCFLVPYEKYEEDPVGFFLQNENIVISIN